MSSNSRLAVTISKNSCWNLLHPCITALLQSYFNKITRGITTTFDSIIKPIAQEALHQMSNGKETAQTRLESGRQQPQIRGPFQRSSAWPH